MFGLGSAVSICQTASLKLFGEIFYSEPKRCGIGRIVSASTSLLSTKTASACIATFVCISAISGNFTLNTFVKPHLCLIKN